MKQKTLVRSLLGLFAAGGATAAAVTLGKRTVKKLDQAEHPASRPSLSHSIGLSRTIMTRKADPLPFTGGIVRVSCGILVYDLSCVPISKDGILQCDVHMGMLHLILPSSVNIRFDAHTQFGSCVCTDERTTAADAPFVTVRASVFMGLLSITKAPENHS